MKFFHSEGARVIATDMNGEKLAELKREQPAIVTDTLDVTRLEDVERLIWEKYTNVLFNCAGWVGSLVWGGICLKIRVHQTTPFRSV